MRLFAPSRLQSVLLTAVWATAVNATPTVTGISYVSSGGSPPMLNGGPASFDYTFDVHVTNDPSPAAYVLVTLTTNDPSLKILQGSQIPVGFLAARASATSKVSIRQNRSGCGGDSCGPANPGPNCANGVIVPSNNKCNLPFRYNALVWTVSFARIATNTAPPTIKSLELVEPSGRAEHQGLMPIPGQPVSTSTGITCLVNFTSPLASGIAKAVSASGQILAQGSFASFTDTDAVATDYTASLVAPAVPFRLMVQGTDLQGKSVNLAWPELFKPSTVEVRFPQERMRGVIGSTVEVPVRVTNGGGPQMFKLIVSASPSTYAVMPHVSTVQLGSNQVVDLTVTVQIPSQTNSQNLATLQAFLISTTDARISNTAVMRVGADSSAL